MQIVATAKKSLESPRVISLMMAIMQLIKGLASIALVMMTASIFGAGIERDAWVLAWSTQIIITKVMFGPINETFRSKFSGIKNQTSETNALQSVFSLTGFIAFIALFIIGSFCLFRHEIVALFAAGYTNLSDRKLVEMMVLILIPNVLLGELIAIGVAVLNSYKQFYWPEIMGLLTILLNMLLLWLFGSKLGIYSLAIAHYCSSLILLMVLFRKIKLVYPHALFTGISWQKASPFLMTSLPLFLMYGAGQINAWSEKFLVSFLQVGNNTVLDYARRFIDLPITMLVSIATVVMTPLITKIWHEEKNSSFFQSSFMIYLRLGILIISPVIMLFIVCPETLVTLILKRGNFTNEWVAPTASVLRWFGLGLFGVACYSLSGQALIVQGRSKVYAIIGVFTQLIPILINVIFFEKIGLELFAISWSVAQFVFGIVMFRVLKFSDKQLLFQWFVFLLVISIAILVLYLFKDHLSTLSNFNRLVVLSIEYSILLLVGLVLIQADELKSFKNLKSKQ